MRVPRNSRRDHAGSTVCDEHRSVEYITVLLYRAAIQNEDESRQVHCVLEELALPEMTNDAIELCDALSEAAEQVSISTWFE